MGIFSEGKQTSAYVPPQNGGNSTLLGEGALPSADVRDDLNRSPSTRVDLRFVRYKQVAVECLTGLSL